VNAPLSRFFPAFFALLSGALFLIGAGLLASCQSTDPAPGDQILHLTLDDSLSRYDSVSIVVVDAKDTSLILERIWYGPLLFPSKIPAKTLTAAKDKPFAVKIVGYGADDQIALRTLIYYEGGKSTVVHDPLPPVVPKKWLKRLSPSAGVLSPALNPDSLNYQLTLPDGITSFTLDIVASHQNALVVIENDTIRRGAPPPSFNVGANPDTIPVTVIDALGMKRVFRVALVPHKPVPVELARIEIIAPEILDPEFDFETTEYVINVYAGSDSATVKFYPSDPSTMSMTLTDDGVSHSILPQNPYRAGIPKGEEVHHFTLSVKRGIETKDYELYLTRS
jgi:hypothetical protein